MEIVYVHKFLVQPVQHKPRLSKLVSTIIFQSYFVPLEYFKFTYKVHTLNHLFFSHYQTMNILLITQGTYFLLLHVSYVDKPFSSIL